MNELYTCWCNPLLNSALCAVAWSAAWRWRWAAGRLGCFGDAAHEPDGRRAQPRRAAGRGHRLLFLPGCRCRPWGWAALSPDFRGADCRPGQPLHQRARDASFAAFYLLALSVGVLLVSKYGSNVDLIHILFGTVLAVDDAALLLVASIALAHPAHPGGDLPAAAAGKLRPGVLQSVGASGGAYHLIFWCWWCSIWWLVFRRWAP